MAAKRADIDERASIRLPAATRGDVMVETASGDDTELVTGGTEGTRTVFYDYLHAVSGLLAVLEFDAHTRTISGTRRPEVVAVITARVALETFSKHNSAVSRSRALLSLLRSTLYAVLQNGATPLRKSHSL